MTKPLPALFKIEYFHDWWKKVEKEYRATIDRYKAGDHCIEHYTTSERCVLLEVYALWEIPTPEPMFTLEGEEKKHGL